MKDKNGLETNPSFQIFGPFLWHALLSSLSRSHTNTHTHTHSLSLALSYIVHVHSARVCPQPRIEDIKAVLRCGAASDVLRDAAAGEKKQF